MLIVGREIGQSVIIGDVVKATVLQSSSKLRLKIDAPKHFNISRLKGNDKGWEKLKKGARVIGDTIQIGETIKITIIQTESGLIRFAIDAPKEISIYREELYNGNHMLTSQIV